MQPSTDPLELLVNAARHVVDPVSGQSVWDAELIQDWQLGVDGLVVVLDGPTLTPESLASIRRGLLDHFAAAGFEWPIQVVPRDDVAGSPVEGESGLRCHVVAVCSGKGGVGKSTVATNLAVALSMLGRRVGLLDADVFGPSVHLMMSTDESSMGGVAGGVCPVDRFGVRCLSMGMLVDASEAVIWRGPMVAEALADLATEQLWQGLDILVVDLPPGTGEVPITLLERLSCSALVVTTPQHVAQADARRGVTMLQQYGVPILGVVENMAYYRLPDGTRDYIFGQGGAERLADQCDAEVLCQVPLNRYIREQGDVGTPAAVSSPIHRAVFERLARVVVSRLGGV